MIIAGAEVLQAFDEVGLAPESALLALPEEQRELLVLRQRLAHVGQHSVVVVEFDLRGLRRERDLDRDAVGIDPDPMRDRWPIVEPYQDRDRHAKPVRHIFLPYRAVEHEWVVLIDQPRDLQVWPVGRHVHAVHPLVEEPVHRFAERPGDRRLEGIGAGGLEAMIRREATHQIAKSRVVTGLEVSQHHSEHVQNECALFIHEESVVVRRLSGSQPIPDHERA